MTSCEIGRVSTPISLAVQENSFIHSCFGGKSPISVFTKQLNLCMKDTRGISFDVA